MLVEEYDALLAQANAARSVHELRRIADHARATFPGDPDAEQIDATCFTYATALIEHAATRRQPDRSRTVTVMREPEVTNGGKDRRGVRPMPAPRLPAVSPFAEPALRAV
jgi:hypothetical protein